ncbi:hypothetical protein DYU11_19630 [Fibrisoma montanum]|uniref:Uncharacterized protein n=1 Tax=Fibrisoma montanum TaxID=2305895 RepID=A0A418M6R7_9BACT|nr:hypothetical protein DYU11_19630 [Fibrisoma montanum]
MRFEEEVTGLTGKKVPAGRAATLAESAADVPDCAVSDCDEQAVINTAETMRRRVAKRLINDLDRNKQMYSFCLSSVSYEQVFSRRLGELTSREFTFVTL